MVFKMSDLSGVWLTIMRTRTQKSFWSRQKTTRNDNTKTIKITDFLHKFESQEPDTNKKTLEMIINKTQAQPVS